MMYQCAKCYEMFAEPIADEVGGYAEEKMYVYRCPDCGSDDIEELLVCECCGTGYIPKFYGDGTPNHWVELCEDCMGRGRILYNHAKFRFPNIDVDLLFTGNVYEHMKDLRVTE